MSWGYPHFGKPPTSPGVPGSSTPGTRGHGRLSHRRELGAKGGRKTRGYGIPPIYFTRKWWNGKTNHRLRNFGASCPRTRPYASMATQVQCIVVNPTVALQTHRWLKDLMENTSFRWRYDDLCGFSSAETSPSIEAHGQTSKILMIHVDLNISYTYHVIS